MPRSPILGAALVLIFAVPTSPHVHKYSENSGFLPHQCSYLVASRFPILITVKPSNKVAVLNAFVNTLYRMLIGTLARAINALP
jgi:hypothetical protein